MINNNIFITIMRTLCFYAISTANKETKSNDFLLLFYLFILEIIVLIYDKNSTKPFSYMHSGHFTAVTLKKKVSKGPLQKRKFH